MAKVISVGNKKRGVGKPTTAVQIAQALGKQGKKVILLDADDDLQCAVKWRHSVSSRAGRLKRSASAQRPTVRPSEQTF